MELRVRDYNNAETVYLDHSYGFTNSSHLNMTLHFANNNDISLDGAVYQSGQSRLIATVTVTIQSMGRDWCYRTVEGLYASVGAESASLEFEVDNRLFLIVGRYVPKTILILPDSADQVCINQRDLTFSFKGELVL